jgi:hypothetical protein
MDAAGFIKERVGLFKDFTAERIKQLVDGSLVRSFEPNEVITQASIQLTRHPKITTPTSRYNYEQHILSEKR